MKPELKELIKVKIDHHIKVHQSIVDELSRFRTNVANNVFGIMRIMLEEHESLADGATLEEIVEVFNEFTQWDAKVEEGTTKIIYPWNQPNP